MSKAVRMTEHIDGGWWEGEPAVWHDYPAKGETAVLDNDHADSLVASGRAEFATVKEARAEAKDAETAAVKDDSEKRGGESVKSAKG